MNGYYFHPGFKEQREIIDKLIEEQTNRWLGSFSKDDLEEEDLTVLQERIRESFKYRFYKLITDISRKCIFELKKLIEELFELPIDEELHQQSQRLYDFFGI